ncbi:MAG: S-layer homology domain-containing protein [Schaedlerella sp.]|nr:S-layer homology domain-containing protein [Lachnospiraceae bacterium]MDY4201537.1 S-layer homology domain-containing protein [Schaedlerella sp.]
MRKKLLSLFPLMILLLSLFSCLAVNAKDAYDYNDVKPGTWYYGYISDVSTKGLMTGMNETTFNPNGTLVRAQFATILYRMAGTPYTEYTYKFPDIPNGEFYSMPVTWANNHAIVTGYANTGLFGPNDFITREQLATMLHRYWLFSGFDTGVKANLSNYPDASKVSAFAKDAMGWAVGHGLIQGDNGYLNPQGIVNRAVCATMIARFTGYSEPSTPQPPINQNPEIPTGDYTYVLNTSTMKFHYQNCKDVPKISPENYSTSNATRDYIIVLGYSPCGHCHP